MKEKTNVIKRLLTGRGFYVALALTLIATGVAGWLGTSAGLFGKNNNGGTSSWENAGVNQSSVAKESSTLLESELSSLSPSSQQGSSSNMQESSGSVRTQEKLLYILPVTGKISFDFSAGEMVFSQTMQDYRLHTGIDIEAEKGREVRATAEGKVVKIYEDPMWGNVIEIAHPDGNTSVYANLSDSATVKKGEYISSGIVISTVGESADIETDEVSHLHFAVRCGDEYLDPLSLVSTLTEED